MSIIDNLNSEASSRRRTAFVTISPLIYVFLFGTNRVRAYTYLYNLHSGINKATTRYIATIIDFVNGLEQRT